MIYNHRPTTTKIAARQVGVTMRNCSLYLDGDCARIFHLPYKFIGDVMITINGIKQRNFVDYIIAFDSKVFFSTAAEEGDDVQAFGLVSA